MVVCNSAIKLRFFFSTHNFTAFFFINQSKKIKKNQNRFPFPYKKIGCLVLCSKLRFSDIDKVSHYS